MPTEELFGAYHFLLEIQGVINDNKIIVGGFKSVSGMDSETEIVEFKQYALGRQAVWSKAAMGNPAIQGLFKRAAGDVQQGGDRKS